MKLVELKGENVGTAEIDGVRCEVNFSLLEEVHLGDYLIVHAGFAIEKLDEQEALKQIELLREIGA